MNVHSIIEFQKWLKDMEDEMLLDIDSPVGKMWIRGVFSQLQAELTIKFEDESHKMATHYEENI